MLRELITTCVFRDKTRRFPLGVGILGTGSHVPSRVVGNTEVGTLAGVDDEWIRRKTGIRERRYAAEDEATSDLAVAAARRALEDAGADVAELSLVVVATSTPDSPQPPTAAVVAHRLGAPARAAAFDLNAVCSGFVFALDLARRHVAEGGLALVIAAEVYSRVIDPADRRTAVLLGDGAGAAVLGPVPGDRGVLGARLSSYGELAGVVRVEAGGSRVPTSAATIAAGMHHFRMEGRAVVEFVRGRVPPEVERLLADAELAPADVDHVITHQANGHLIRALVEDLGLPAARLHTTVERYGNTGAASSAITLDQARRCSDAQAGAIALLVTFGGGMSVAVALLRL
ncbi:3-oxoacyl-ACP synthase III family protein [Saccharopolyspora sp. MS10]|uniref:3-oxoacyl-ACP synthase III family protein n=1 Tax=Saccharopolyspora sp. MS10 TaxID=3385973 RepID=UPI0039A3807E